MTYKGIILDAFGTIVDIGDKRNPYKQLLQIGVQQGRPIYKDDATFLMSHPLSISQAADKLGIRLTDDELNFLCGELKAELDSIFLYDDTIPTLTALRERGLKIAVCSNLALPYVYPVSELVRPYVDVCTWSCHVGVTKPHYSIYHKTCHALKLYNSSVMMVGDSFEADVDGPICAGLSGHWLRRNDTDSDVWFKNLHQLVDYLI